MRAIPNLIEEAEFLIPDDVSLTWSQVWGAEVLGRALGHELRHELETAPIGEIGQFGDIIDSSLPLVLVQHHIADVIS